MEHISRSLPYNPDILNRACYFLPQPAEKVCYFDIETTGLSPQVSSLYLIGAATVQNGQWQLTQWFADDYISEEEILRSFASFSSSFDIFVHYNGSTFDIPYLEKKYRASHLPSPFAVKESLDLFRNIKKRKIPFPVPNRKLTTMEHLAGFERHDTYSGKDCIRLYTDFMQNKYFRNPNALKLKENLLLHNQDDLIGTIMCGLLLAYGQYEPVSPSLAAKEKEISLTDILPQPVPVPLSYEEDGIHYHYEKNHIRITIPLLDDTLFHFFPDYKNYYYLPEEDMAVHKSVGTYVDPAFRQKATASNCYIKKTGTFLPLPKGTVWSAPVFSFSRKDSRQYIPWTKDTVFSEEELVLLLTGFMHKPQ